MSDKNENKFMVEFLNDFRDILIKHNVTIVRSASETSRLVVSMQMGDAFDEIEFDEEIGESSIKHNFYKQL